MSKQKEEGIKQNKRRTANRRCVERASTPQQLEEWIDAAMDADPDFDCSDAISGYRHSS